MEIDTWRENVGTVFIHVRKESSLFAGLVAGRTGIDGISGEQSNRWSVTFCWFSDSTAFLAGCVKRVLLLQ